MKIEASYKQIKENNLKILDNLIEQLKESTHSNRFTPIEKFKFYYDCNSAKIDNDIVYTLYITAEFQDLILKSELIHYSPVPKLIVNAIIEESKLKEEQTSNPVSMDEIEHALIWIIGDYLEMYYTNFAKDTDKDGNNLFDKFCRGIRGICHKLEIDPDKFDKFRILLKSKG